MASWTFRPVVKWQPGAGASLGQHSSSLGKQWSRAGRSRLERVRELQRISRQKAAAAQVGGGPATSGYLPRPTSRLAGRPENFDGGQKPEGN